MESIAYIAQVSKIVLANMSVQAKLDQLQQIHAICNDVFVQHFVIHSIISMVYFRHKKWIGAMQHGYLMWATIPVHMRSEIFGSEIFSSIRRNNKR